MLKHHTDPNPTNRYYDQEGSLKPTNILDIRPELALSVAARIAARSNENLDTGCWEWTGPLDKGGYGKLNLVIDGRKRKTGAHRAAWLATRGPIPPFFVIDHLCRNRACVNVNHLEPVDNAENVRRGFPGRPLGLGDDHKCGSHGREDGYEKTRPDGYTYWACRVCRRAASARYKARQKLK